MKTRIRKTLLALTIATLCVTAPVLAATASVKVSPAHAQKAPALTHAQLLEAETNCERGSDHCQIRPRLKASVKK
jgi:hypothetical protein